MDVIYFHSEDGSVEIRHPGECWHCGSCCQDSPASAITILFPPIMANISNKRLNRREANLANDSIN